MHTQVYTALTCYVTVGALYGWRAHGWSASKSLLFSVAALSTAGIQTAETDPNTGELVGELGSVGRSIYIYVKYTTVF